MAFGTPVVGTAIYGGVGNLLSSIAYPAGILAGDAIVLIVGQKPSTANGGGVTTPTGFTLRASLTGAGGYGTTTGTDVGNCNLYFFTKDVVDGTESGTTLSVTLADNNAAYGYFVHAPTSRGQMTYGSATGSQATTPTTPLSVTLGADPGFTAGDLALWAMTIATDDNTPAQFSSHTISATGATFATPVELSEPDSTTNRDIGGMTAYALVNSGTSSGAPTIGAAIAGIVTNVRGPVVMLRLREGPPLVGNNVVQEDTSTTGTIGQTHLLSGNSVNQEDTSTTGAIGQTHVLTGNNVINEFTCTTGAISQEHVLTGNNVQQVNQSTTGGVAQTHVLAGNNPVQVNQSTSGAVSQTHILSGNSVRQDNTSTTGEWTTTQDLAGNNVRQNNLSTNGAVTQTHLLAGNSVQNAIVCTTGAIQQRHVLQAASVAVDNVATASPIVQIHLLAGESVVQENESSDGAMSGPSPMPNTARTMVVRAGRRILKARP